MHRLVIAAGLIVVLIAVVWFGVWTHRRLWHHGAANPYEQFVYTHGVRRFGAFMAVGLVFIPAFSSADGLAGGGDFTTILLAWLTSAIFAWPLGLWGGYWWGRSMAAFFGLKRNDRPQN